MPTKTSPGDPLHPVNPEIGPELLADELVVSTVVVLKKSSQTFAGTFWVRDILPHMVLFGAYTINTILGVRRNRDGSLTDYNTGEQIHAYVWLQPPPPA